MSKVIQKVITVETNSSMIAEMTYDRDEMRLWVTFTNKNIYSYDAVPETLFTQLISESTESIGKFFHQNIRKYPGLYPYKRCL